ncbi:MAG: hypothetical protein AAGI37_08435 [Planctomycetota bacterium]
MGQLDLDLLDAWGRVYEQCRRDPKEARRCYERMHAGGMGLLVGFVMFTAGVVCLLTANANRP